MISVVRCMVVTLLFIVDDAFCGDKDYSLDQVADESYQNVYHAKMIPEDKLLNKYGDILKTNNASFNIFSNNSANIFNVTLDDNKLIHFNNNYTTTQTNNSTSEKKGKFVFPKLNPMPDLTGWITIIPLDNSKDGGTKRHGIFRIGRFQNGQYYLNPIRKPGQNLYSSGELDSLFLPRFRKLQKSFRTNYKVLNKKMNSGFSNNDLYQETNPVPVYVEDSVATDSRSHKTIINTKIKHHHHHHHHKYLQTVLKKIPVHVPVKVYVDKPYIVEKKIAVPVEKVVNKVVHKEVPVFIKKEVKVPYPVKVPAPYPVEVIKKEYVPKPYPVVKKVPVYKEIKIPIYHHHTVEKPIPYPIKVPYEVKVPYPVEVEKKVPYPVKVYVPKPVEKIVKQTVYEHVPVPVYIDKYSHSQNEILIPQPSQQTAVITQTPEPSLSIVPIRVYAPERLNEQLLERKSSGKTLSENLVTNSTPFKKI